MANSLEFQITEEGYRNAIVKLTGILDTSNISEIPAISISQFNNNDPRLVLSGFRVDLIEWSMSSDMEINLAWQSDNPQQLFPIAGRGRINSTNYGGFIPDKNRPGYTGGIQLVTTGYIPGTTQNFSLAIELVKLYKS